MHFNTAVATSTSDSGASAEDISLDKNILRSQIRPRRLIARSERGPAGQQRVRDLFTENILREVRERLHSRYGCRVPAHPSEPPITEALTHLHEAGHRIIVPVVRPRRTLAWVEWDPTVDHPCSPMGIPEPEGEERDVQAFVEADVRLIPALAYDAAGHRLGQEAVTTTESSPC